MRRGLHLGLALALCAAAASARDWAKYPAVAQIAHANEIFAIGDAHGDYVRLAGAMAAAGIIEGRPARPEDARWCAGHAVLVVTGDMIDKGPRAVDVLRLLMAVREDARRAGGNVVILAGNHEAEFLADTSPDSPAPKGRAFAKQLKAAGMDPAQVRACGGEIGEFLCSLPFAARVNDWFFSHAGNAGGRTVAKLTLDLQEGLDREGYRTKQLIGADSLLEARLNGQGRNVWIDAGMPERGEKELLVDDARALGVKHIVEGHVPSAVAFADGIKRERGEMFQRFGLLFLIDTGMSQGVDDSGGAVLDIAFGGGERATATCPDGKRTLLWDSVANQDVGRAPACAR